MLKTFATICIIGMFTSSCTSKKASRTEGSHEAEQDLTMIVGTYTSGDSKGLYSFRFNEENGTAANSATNKLLPTHLLSIRRKELSDC